jgi:hypothetical protein
MTQQPVEPKKQNSHLQTVFSTFPFIGAFSLSQLANYPYNFLLFLIPFLVCEGILIVFYINKLNKKKQSALAVDPKNPVAVAKPKPKGTIVEKYEISDNTLKFSVMKGFYKKQWVAIKEIPVYEIVGIESLGNELSVTWRGATDWFVLQKKGASFNGLSEQIKSLLDEHQETLEAQAKAAKRKADVTALLNFSVGIVDSSFDMLMGFQVKPVNWEKLDIYTDSLLEKTGFAAQTLAPLTLDFSKVADAVKSQVPETASKEIFDVLKEVYVYFEELNLEDDVEQAHPNFKDAKAVILACFTLNDVWLGKIVGEKDSQKESQVLEGALQSLANDTSFKVNFEALKAGFDKIGLDAELEGTIEDTREIFLGQLRNIDRSIEQLPIEQTPTELPEPLMTAPQELARSPKPMVPTQPSEPKAAAIELQPVVQPPTEAVQVEQEEPVMPLELEQPINPPEPQIEQAVEPTVVEEQKALPPSTGELVVQMQEPTSAEVSMPTTEDVTKAPEVAPKKKSFGQRLRKSVMGY